MHIFTIIILIYSVQGENQNGRMYKRLILDGSEWSKFISKTIPFYVKTKIECGASCSHHDSGCDLFIFKPELKKCYLGITENGNPNYLTGQTGISLLYYNTRKFQLLL